MLVYGVHVEANYYQNLATVIKWVDGDTVDLTVDLGFGIKYHDQRFRLFRSDTPERGQVNFHEATAFSSNMAPPGSTILVRTYKVKRSYDRYIAEIIVLKDGEHVSVNEALVAAGLAVIDPRF